jgi:hypothetical protein
MNDCSDCTYYDNCKILEIESDKVSTGTPMHSPIWGSIERRLFESCDKKEAR